MIAPIHPNPFRPLEELSVLAEKVRLRIPDMGTDYAAAYDDVRTDLKKLEEIQGDLLPELLVPTVRQLHRRLEELLAHSEPEIPPPPYDPTQMN